MLYRYNSIHIYYSAIEHAIIIESDHLLLRINFTKVVEV
jgi:hypothetical protein